MEADIYHPWPQALDARLVGRLSATAGRCLPGAERIGDHSVLEVALPSPRDGELVAEGIAQAAAFPAQAGPLGADGAVNRPGSRCRSPVDGAAVGEVVESSDAVGGTGLISGRIAEESGGPSQGLVLGQDGPADPVTPSGRRGEGRALR